MRTIEDSLEFVGRFVPVAKSYIARRLDEVKPEFPLVLKIVSQRFVHKTEVMGVRIVNNQEELGKNFDELKRIKGVNAVLVQEFVKGTELIVGLKQDASFGHAIMFGVGGIMAELLKDVSFRICPITDKDAQSMIDDLKAKDLLTGFRGQKPVNLRLLKRILIRISEIPGKYPDLKELDINPLVINDKDALVVDARLELC